MLTIWRVVLVQDGRWEFEVDTVASLTLHTSRGSRQWRNIPAEAGLSTLSTTNTGGDRGLVAWSEE